ncbi:3-dehydrosphinganine reductase [Savitreella phatthalungensis]
MVLGWLLPRAKPDYRGKHVVVTGGSQGMGKSVAAEFIRRGAHVTILARTQKTLDEAHAELKQLADSLASKNGKVAASPSLDRLTPQRVQAYSCDCSNLEQVKNALEQAGTPDVLFCCAGTAHPGFFLELTTEQLTKPMHSNYDSAVICAHTAVKMMLKEPSRDAKFQRKIVFTSTVAAFLGLVGYDAYAPTKAAIRNLADTLRQEFLMYNISVHCVFPATIYSPSFVHEQEIKPELLKILEEGDSGQTPDQVARAAIKGLGRGYHHIPTEWQGDLLRTNMQGPSPSNNVILDAFKGFAARIALPFIIMDQDSKVRKYGRQHKIAERHAQL